MVMRMIRKLNLLSCCWAISIYLLGTMDGVVAAPSLVYKMTNTYNLAWQFWGVSGRRPTDSSNSRYFPLGDVFPLNARPDGNQAMMVQDNGDGLVAPPASITPFFAAREIDGTMCQLNPPPGYTCMGFATSWNFNNVCPDKNQFRCLRSDLVTPGDTSLAWSNAPISFWSVIPSSSTGLATGAFVLSNSPTAKPTKPTYVVLASMAVETIDKPPLLVYKRTHTYTVSWRGAGMTSWRPLDLSNRGYLPLGDVIYGGDTYPEVVGAMMVLDNGDGLVAPPASITPFFSTREFSVTYCQLNPPPGYTCMGFATYWDNNKCPSNNEFRCLRSDLVTPGSFEFLWGSNKYGKSGWRVIPKTLNKGGAVLETGTYVMFHTTNSVPPGSKSFVIIMLKATTVHPSDPNPKDVALVLYETPYTDSIWNDAVAKTDVSAGTHKGSIFKYYRTCCHLGDPISKSREKSATYIASEIKKGTLSPPASFHLVYSNSGSKAWKVSIWKAKCLDGYVPLGTYAQPNYDAPDPKAVNFRCVKQSMVNTGKWTWMWNDAKSGSKQDGTFWRADAVAKGDIGISVMSAQANYADMVEEALVLDGTNVSLSFGKPIKSVVLMNMNYDLDNEVVIGTTESDITSGARLRIDNCEKKGEIKGIRTLSYTKSEEKSWTWSVSVTVGASVTVGLFGNDVETSLSVTASGGETNTKSTSTTDTVSAELPVEPGNSDSFFVSGTKELVNIPWTATADITYTDGTTGEMPTSGMYTGRSISEVVITRGSSRPCTPADSTTPAPASG